MVKNTIYTRFTLGTDDVNCLHLLYMPLIGNDAISLYMFFHSYVNRRSMKSESVKIDEILDILGWRLQKYNDAKAKLEGINLIKTYQNAEEIVIILLSPVTPRNFFNDSNLGLYLMSKVGEKIHDKLYKKFIIPDLDLGDFENVTKSFDEVFKTALITSEENLNANLVGRKPNQGSVLSNFDFDIDLFISKIDKNFLDDGITSDFKKKMKSIAYVYGFTIEQMVNLYNDAIDKNGNFSYDVFKRKSGNLYNYLYNNNGPELVIKTENNDVIFKFDNMTALELLNQVVGSNDYPVIYLKKIAEIYEKINLPHGVLNVMIAMVYREKETIPSINYFIRIADSWVNKGIVSTALALKYIEDGSYPNQNDFVDSKPRAKSNRPDIELEDWQKESFDNLMKGYKG